MIHKSMIVHYDRNSAGAEAYRKLRTNILFSKDSDFPKVLMITSTGTNEGKTTTACNLGLAFAQSGHKTIIIDGDLRRPTVHQLFGLSRLKGLSTLLSKESTLEDTTQHIEEANVDVIPSGPSPKDPAELLSTKALDGLIDELKQTYDIIIIDTPPVGLIIDAAILSTVSSGVIIVLKEGSVSSRQFKYAKEQIERVGGKIVGAIFNMVGEVPGNKYYYYYSNSYYGYSSIAGNKKEVRKKIGFMARIFKRKPKS